MRSSSDRAALRVTRGTTVAITGAGSGIGRLVALGAARRGAHAVIDDRDGAAALAGTQPATIEGR